MTRVAETATHAVRIRVPAAAIPAARTPTRAIAGLEAVSAAEAVRLRAWAGLDDSPGCGIVIRIRLMRKISCIIILAVLSSSTGAWGGQAGTVTISTPSPAAVSGDYCSPSDFQIKGTYIRTQDDTPKGNGFYFKYYDYPFDWIYAELKIKIDGVERSTLGTVSDWGANSTFNKLLNYTTNNLYSFYGLNTAAQHSATIYLIDVYGSLCYGNPPQCGKKEYGSIIDQKTFTFRISRDVDKDGFSTCDGDSAENRCNDNDASIYPGAPELCDKKDNDCDGEVDEGCNPCANDPCCENPDPCKCGFGGSAGGGRGPGGGNDPAVGK